MDILLLQSYLNTSTEPLVRQDYRASAYYRDLKHLPSQECIQFQLEGRHEQHRLLLPLCHLFCTNWLSYLFQYLVPIVRGKLNILPLPDYLLTLELIS